MQAALFAWRNIFLYGQDRKYRNNLWKKGILPCLKIKENVSFKPSRLVGKQANRFSRSKATLQKWVKRHTRPTGAVRIRAEGARFKYSNLCTHTYPYRLAKLGTSLRIRGKLIIRKKKFIVLNCITCLFCQKNKKREPSPLVGEGGGASRRKRQEWAEK